MGDYIFASIGEQRLVSSGLPLMAAQKSVQQRVKRYMSRTIFRMRLSALGLGLAVSAVAAAYAADNTINASSQKVTNNEVIVHSVTTTEDALVVIHPRKESGDKHTADTSVALGHVAVKAGESTDVKVVLEQPVSPGTKLVAVLYADAGEKGRFEPGTDKPIVEPVSNGFTVR